MRTLPTTIFGLVCCVTLLSGCYQKDSSYEPEQNQIVGKLTNKEWVREYNITSPSGSVRESWVFERNGGCTTTELMYYDNGSWEENTFYFSWFFMSTNFNVIYMNYPQYWLIEELTAEKLCVYETLVDPDMVTPQDYREYKEFTSIKK